MSRGQRLAFLAGCLAVTALAGPRSVADLARGLRGPYAEPPAAEVAVVLPDDDGDSR